MTGISRRALIASVSTGGISLSAGCLGDFGRSGNGIDDGRESEERAEPNGFELETVVDGLTHPWGMAFLPDGRLLVTERVGRLLLVDPEAGSAEVLDGTPTVHARGQGGLLDVTIHPDMADEPWVYLTYSATDGGDGSTTRLGRGRLDTEAGRLEAFETIHAAEPYVDSTQHYGSRVVFRDGSVYVTVGDRGFKDFGTEHVSQDTTTELGSTLRLDPDGSIPEDNPFVDDPDVRDSIFSYGHRNAQGMAVHPETGALWQSEHGERDGDELNVIEAGENYGWPIAHYGCEYGTDDPVGDLPHERDDTVSPVYHWPCGSGGFPPAGMTFYDGEAFPNWRGDLFVGNLAGTYLGRFTVDGRDVDERDPLLDDREWRIRDVTTGPENGRIYVAVDADDAPIVRLVPE